MKIKLNNGVTVELYEPIAYLSNNAFYAYNNSDYKIAIGEKKKWILHILHFTKQ